MPDETDDKRLQKALETVRASGRYKVSPASTKMASFRVEDRTLKQFKAEAERRSKKLTEAFKEALDLWIHTK